MKNFNELIDLPLLDLYAEFERLLENNTISWYNNIKDQICLNSTKDDPDNIHLGRGSLIWDWDNFAPGSSNTNMVKKRDIIYNEEDFTEFCSPFKNTLFEEAYNALATKYVLGRVRLMQSKPKTCLTWHVDSTPRVHYPLKTQEGCFMIIEDEIKHLPKHTWWWTNTTVKHTAMNASKDTRIHLVVTVLEEK